MSSSLFRTRREYCLFLYYQLIDANVKPVLNSNQIGPTETPVKIPQIPSDSKSKSEDETCRQKRNKQAKITTVVLALLTFLPIATLIVGQIHKNDCPIQTWIPQWMTIFGAVGLATFGVLIFIVTIEFFFIIKLIYSLVGLDNHFMLFR
jgi:hypothetical protein